MVEQSRAMAATVYGLRLEAALTGVKELVGETEYVGVSYDWRGEAGDQQDCIVVSEGDLVAGEDIHTAAEEVTA